ncbi:MAG: HD domain-containing protein [Thermodesulfobacteriota bacterium]
MKSIAKFLFEVGMLKKTPRSGYQFLGSGRESVADHCFRTSVIGYVLSLQEEGADPNRTVLLCLMHDLQEARTGDLNYVNKRYVITDEDKAVKDMAADLPFGGDIVDLVREFNTGESAEARLARDADQLDLILELKEQLDLGNKYATDWLAYAVKRLQSSTAIEMANSILETDSAEWWFEKRTDLWVNGLSKPRRDKE